MHGEYKVPGGKLVVVDLDVVDGRMSGFRLAGDFFLEPDDALEAIDRAVERPRCGVRLGDHRRRDRARPARGHARCSASRPEAIAVAIRRSLSRATDWRDYDWQIIHDGPSRRTCTSPSTRC